MISRGHILHIPRLTDSHTYVNRPTLCTRFKIRVQQHGNHHIQRHTGHQREEGRENKTLSRRVNHTVTPTRRCTGIPEPTTEHQHGPTCNHQIHGIILPCGILLTIEEDVSHVHHTGGLHWVSGTINDRVKQTSTGNSSHPEREFRPNAEEPAVNTTRKGQEKQI